MELVRPINRATLAAMDEALRYQESLTKAGALRKASGRKVAA